MIKTAINERSVIGSVEDTYQECSNIIVLGIHSRMTTKALIVSSAARHLIEHGHKALLFSS